MPNINIANLETHKDHSTSSLYSNQRSLAHVELENNKIEMDIKVELIIRFEELTMEKIKLKS